MPTTGGRVLSLLKFKSLLSKEVAISYRKNRRCIESTYEMLHRGRRYGPVFFFFSQAWKHLLRPILEL